MTDLGDIVAVGLDLSPETLVRAYAEGVFPWPCEGLPLLWHFPRRRAVLDFASLHVPGRLIRFLKNCSWSYTVNHAFLEVMDACAIREDEGTWITPEMKQAYHVLHELGHAHSIEVWDQGSLVGGIYGVDVGGYFAGESMFHRSSNASKAALLQAIAIQKKAGRHWMDIQVLSPHMEAFGAHEISAAAFKKRLKETNPVPAFHKTGPFSYGAFEMGKE